MWYWGGKEVVGCGLLGQVQLWELFVWVFGAHVDLQGRRKCQALFERLGIDGE